MFCLLKTMRASHACFWCTNSRDFRALKRSPGSSSLKSDHTLVCSTVSRSLWHIARVKKPTFSSYFRYFCSDTQILHFVRSFLGRRDRRRSCSVVLRNGHSWLQTALRVKQNPINVASGRQVLSDTVCCRQPIWVWRERRVWGARRGHEVLINDLGNIRLRGTCVPCRRSQVRPWSSRTAILLLGLDNLGSRGGLAGIFTAWVSARIFSIIRSMFLSWTWLNIYWNKLNSNIWIISE